MALPNINTTIKDGAMGVAGADATGIFAAVGVAALPSNGIITFTDKEDVDGKIGDGPLRDLIVSALSIAKTTVYAIAVEGSTSGTVSGVTAVSGNQGDGKITVTGKPRNEYGIRIDIMASGKLNDGTFRVTIDGLAGKTITIPDGEGKYEIPGTGLTLQFSHADKGFESGDTFTFTTTAPQATNGEILAAINTILDAKKAIEWIAVAGVSNAALWAALATQAKGAESVYQYLFFVAQARYKKGGETVDEYVNALTGAWCNILNSLASCCRLD